MARLQSLQEAAASSFFTTTAVAGILLHHHRSGLNPSDAMPSRLPSHRTTYCTQIQPALLFSTHVCIGSDPSRTER
jgi:hypothetical protein